MQRSWEAIPSDRPSFSEIQVELELLLQEVEVNISLYIVLGPISLNWITIFDVRLPIYPVTISIICVSQDAVEAPNER